MAVKVTRRQMELLIKEASAPGTETVLTEAELNEIVPVLAQIGGVLGQGAIKLGQVAAKGIQVAGPKIAAAAQRSKEFFGGMKDMIAKAAEKIPELKAMMKMVKNPQDLETLFKSADPKLKKQLDKMVKEMGGQMKKSGNCDCPTPQEYEKAGL